SGWLTSGTAGGLAPWCWIGLMSCSLPLVALFVQVPACGANHAKLAVLDQSNRNLLQPGAHHALVEIALGKRAGEQERLDLRQDAASQIDAAAGAVEQRQVAHEAAEQTAEQLERLHGIRVLARHRGGGDLGRRQPAWIGAAQFAQRAIE